MIFDAEHATGTWFDEIPNIQSTPPSNKRVTSAKEHWSTLETDFQMAWRLGRIFPLQNEISTARTASEISNVEGNRRVILLSLDLQSHEQGKPPSCSAPIRVRSCSKPLDGRLFKFLSFIDKWRLLEDLTCMGVCQRGFTNHLTNKDQSLLESNQALLTSNSLSKELCRAKCPRLK